MSSRVRWNYALDAVIGLAFAISGISGLLLWLGGVGGYQGGRNAGYQELLLGISHGVWNDLHVWTSLVMMAGVVVHLVLHWRWIVCATKGFFPKRQAVACSTETSA